MDFLAREIYGGGTQHSTFNLKHYFPHSTFKIQHPTLLTLLMLPVLMMMTFLNRQYFMSGIYGYFALVL